MSKIMMTPRNKCKWSMPYDRSYSSDRSANQCSFTEINQLTDLHTNFHIPIFINIQLPSAQIRPIKLFRFMEDEKPKLTLDNYEQINNKNREEGLLEQALVYLKLREHGCPKMRALIFAKKKQKGIDGTATKDGPAGFRKLVPQKPEGKLVNGWLKGQKLKYVGLRGFSQQIRKNISKEKATITKYNQQSRSKFEQLRLKQKQSGQLQQLIQSGETKKAIQTISSFKDEFQRDKEKRNLFLSYEGVRLDQYTRSYFEKVEEENPDSLIVKLGAFETPLNDERFKLETDWEIAKGRSLSSYEIQGQVKRKQVLQFRKSLTNFKLPPTAENKNMKKFRSTLQNSNKQLITVTLGKFPKKKYEKDEKEFEQFYSNIDKIIWMKTRQSDPGVTQSQILKK